jgi:hypothetical protein
VHAVYFRAPLALAHQRQTTRPACDAVPAAAITGMAAKLRWPTPDEYQTLSIVEQDGTHLAKWVRPSHVQTDQHWMSAAVRPNGLAG